MELISQLKKWCSGSLLTDEHESAPIRELAIDSRNIEYPETALFVAIKTNVRDGHAYIGDAYERGVRHFLVSETPDTSAFPLAGFIQVKDTQLALQQIAAGHRKQFSMPVIGITGSNGKTVVKEWLYQLLGDHFNISRSPKSYNSQLGVPLSVWQMDAEHQLGIFEAGISQPGEMEKLEKVICPTIGIFTNIGEAHSEGFMNQRQKINEKLMLFRHCKHLIYCHDHVQLNECIVPFMHHMSGGRDEESLKLFSWSRKQDAELRITAVDKTQTATTICAVYDDTEMHIKIPFIDEASIENAIHCWCTALLLKVPIEDIQKGMARLQAVSMRLELRHGTNDCTIINDAYNSDLTSLQLALGYLDQQRQHSLHTVIMSDMLQMGRRDLDLYEEVAAQIGKRSIQRFIGIGPSLYKNKSAFRKYKKLRSIFFKSTSDFLKNFHLLTFNREAILLKGARVFEFEKIAMLLEQQIHQTVMTINLAALRHNLDVFRSKLVPGTKTMAMVKAFAYGSGSYEIANLLQQSGIDYLTVAYTDEGIALRKSGITVPIMVMSPDDTSFDRMIAWKLEPEIYSFRALNTFMRIAGTLQVEDYPVHLKLDTGMHRLGFTQEEMNELASVIGGNRMIHVASIFSHLAASDDPAQDAFTQEQAHRFEKMSEELKAMLPYKPMRHLCNSAGILRHPDLHYDMVRIGLGLYGNDSTNTVAAKLHQISSLKTLIAQVHHVAAGENIGYGHHTIAQHDMRIATICIGYADGYPRSLGNGRGHVLIRGQQAPTVGSICMDMCMVDITNIAAAEEGDEAIVFNQELPVTLLAEWASTISYEIMSGISQRVKRVYVNEE